MKAFKTEKILKMINIDENEESQNKNYIVLPGSSAIINKLV